MDTTHDANFLSRVLDRIPGAIYVLRMTPEGAQEFVYANASSSQLFEVDLEAWKHDASKAFANVHPDDLDEWTRRGMDSMTRLVPFRWTGRFRFDGDRIKWVRVVAEPERHADGSTGWVGTAFDVTDEVNAQQEVKQLRAEQAKQQSLFEAVINNLPVGVTVIDADGASILQGVKEYADKVGFDVDLVPVPQSEFFAGKYQTVDDHDISVGYWTAVTAGIMYINWRPSTADDPNYSNSAFWNDASDPIDATLAGNSESDPTKQAADYATAQQYIADHALSIGVYDRLSTLAVSPKLHGVWQENAQGGPTFYDAYLTR